MAIMVTQERRMRVCVVVLPSFGLGSTDVIHSFTVDVGENTQERR